LFNKLFLGNAILGLSSFEPVGQVLFWLSITTLPQVHQHAAFSGVSISIQHHSNKSFSIQQKDMQ
jgi:hypothetical protein